MENDQWHDLEGRGQWEFSLAEYFHSPTEWWKNKWAFFY